MFVFTAIDGRHASNSTLGYAFTEASLGTLDPFSRARRT